MATKLYQVEILKGKGEKVQGPWSESPLGGHRALTGILAASGKA